MSDVLCILASEVLIHQVVQPRLLLVSCNELTSSSKLESSEFSVLRNIQNQRTWVLEIPDQSR